MTFKIEERTWKTLDSLDVFHRYWRKSEELISQDANAEEILHRPNWQPKSDSDYGEYQAEVASIREFHDHNMKRILRYSCTALLYSLVEVELRRFIQNRTQQPLVTKSRGEGFLDAFSRVLRESCSLDAEGFRQYPSIVGLQKVRHAIIHCFGDMKYVKPPNLKQDLVHISDLQDKGILCMEDVEIIIDERFVEQKIRDSWDFFVELFRWADWEIGGIWLTKWKQESES